MRSLLCQLDGGGVRLGYVLDYLFVSIVNQRRSVPYAF